MYLFVFSLLVNCFICGLSYPQGSSGVLTCTEPYTCTTVKHCGRQHANRSSSEILFYCDATNRSKVCCPPSNTSSSRDTSLRKITYSNHPNWRLLPKKEECGQPSNDKIIEGERAFLGQFPWMALLGFRSITNGNIGYVCGATLISKRYVLTAAHCLTTNDARLDHVRLGEHDTSTHTDCNSEGYCQEPEDVQIEEIIIHENWDNPTLKNDIGLIRLKNEVVRTRKHIAPICLPFDLSQYNITDESHFSIAGWGKTDWQDKYRSNVLLHADIDGKQLSECRICQEDRPPSYCPLDNTQVCVQGVHGVDVCKGDSGGPLMTLKTVPTFQVGITSFKSVEECGAQNIPSIFTRTEKFLKWILDNIKE